MYKIDLPGEWMKCVEVVERALAQISASRLVRSSQLDEAEIFRFVRQSVAPWVADYPDASMQLTSELSANSGHLLLTFEIKFPQKEYDGSTNNRVLQGQHAVGRSALIGAPRQQDLVLPKPVPPAKPYSPALSNEDFAAVMQARREKV